MRQTDTSARTQTYNLRQGLSQAPRLRRGRINWSHWPGPQLQGPHLLGTPLCGPPTPLPACLPFFPLLLLKHFHKLEGLRFLIFLFCCVLSLRMPQITTRRHPGARQSLFAA